MTVYPDAHALGLVGVRQFNADVTVRPIDRRSRLVCHGLGVIPSARRFASHSYMSNTVTANFNFIADVLSYGMAVLARTGVLCSCVGLAVSGPCPIGHRCRRRYF